MRNLNIGINTEERARVHELLTIVLADMNVLSKKYQSAHWNVEGVNFMELHQFFDKHYHEVSASVGRVAERIKSLGGVAQGGLKSSLASTQLHEFSVEQDYSNQHKIIRSLLVDHEMIVAFLRTAIEEATEDYGDIGTAHFLTGLIQEHEKMAWFLRAYLPEKRNKRKTGKITSNHHSLEATKNSEIQEVVME